MFLSNTLYNYIIYNIQKKIYSFHDKACLVTYWDTPGDYEYLVDTIHLCSNMAGIVFLFDGIITNTLKKYVLYNNIIKYSNYLLFYIYNILGTNLNSFLSLKNWINEYEKNNSNNTHVFKIILCNLKTFGEERKIQYNEGFKLAKSINADYIEFQ